MKEEKDVILPTKGSHSICICASYYLAVDFLNEFLFLDDTPCGELIEE